MGEEIITGAMERREPGSQKGERGERGERGKAACRRLHKKNTLPKPLTGKTRWDDYCIFTSCRAGSLKFLKSAPLPGSSLAGSLMLPWRRPEARERTAYSEDSLSRTRRAVPLLGVHLGEVTLPLGDKRVSRPQ